MATLAMKTKEKTFRPQLTAWVPLRADVMGDNAHPVSVGAVPPGYVYNGDKFAPFVTLTTPSGMVTLYPEEVRKLRDMLEAFDAGKVTYSPGRVYRAESRYPATYGAPTNQNGEEP